MSERRLSARWLWMSMRATPRAVRTCALMALRQAREDASPQTLLIDGLPRRSEREAVALEALSRPVALWCWRQRGRQRGTRADRNGHLCRRPIPEPSASPRCLPCLKVPRAASPVGFARQGSQAGPCARE